MSVVQHNFCRALRTAVWAVACLLGGASLAHAEAPTLDRVYPAGGQRGTKVDVVCQGKFDWPVKVWVPGAEVEVGSEAGKLTIAIPQELASDRLWIRLYNQDGASAAVPFLLDNLSEIVEVEPNNAPDKAQALAAEASPGGGLELMVNGVLQAADDVDGFAIELAAGQTLVAAVAANTALGSPMDSILQVATPGGLVLAENHDDVGLDPRLTFTAPQAGTFVVRLFAFPSEPNSSIRFSGGKDYIYRLTLTTGPYITHAVPLSVSQAAPDTVEAQGWNMPSERRVAVRTLGEAAQGPGSPEEVSQQDVGQQDVGQQDVGQGVGTLLAQLPEFEPSDRVGLGRSRIAFLSHPQMAASARLRLVPHAVLSTAADTSEQQPLNLTIPTAVSGCIQTPRYQDYFSLPLVKDQTVNITVESVSLDSPLVPLVRLIDPDGKAVAEVLESGLASDATLTYKAAVSGDFLFTVRDRYQHGGPRYFYRLTVAPQESDFYLDLASDSLVVAADQPLEIPVTIHRLAGTGSAVQAITIEAVDLPAGIHAEPVVSAASGDTSGKVTLKLESTGVAFAGPIRIRGTAEESNLQRYAHTPVKFGASFDRLWLTAKPAPAAAAAAAP